jgi:N-acetylgalactosamine kinase
LQLRYGALSEAFQAQFGFPPSFFARAPGRVNLIGEHVDYHGYSVLPMALETQDVIIAVGKVTDGSFTGVKVANSNSSKFPTAEIPANPLAPVELGSNGPRWYQYVQCGYKGAFEWAKEHNVKAQIPGEAGSPGLCYLVDGRVPPGAGLSSSSALVCASLLATAHALGFAATSAADAKSKVKMTRADIADAARACETHIGTMSGGMDQAISCLAEQGEAARIDFLPTLKATSVRLPDDAVFIVGHTLEESVKAVDAEKRYNRRVTEGALASKLLAKKLGVPNWSEMFTLRDVQLAMKLPSPSALLSAIEKLLPTGALSLADLEGADLLGAPVPSLFPGTDRKSNGAKHVISSLGKDDKELMLQARARHVASEANRVFDFQAACEGKVRKADGVSTVPLEGGSEASLKAMGELMNQSQYSCAGDYDCSSPGLDELTALARDNGALGSRLTGAGWGGCAVSLVRKSQVAGFIEALKKGYYAKRGKGGDDKELSQFLFATPPGSGILIYTPPTSFEI